MANIDSKQLHDLLCQATIDSGGIQCEDFVKAQEGMRLADVLFPDDRLIVEVKSITTDRNDLRSSRQAAGRIYKQWADKGLVESLTGEFSIRIGELPKKLARALLAERGKRVRRELSNANAQIRDTAIQCGWGNSMGLVIFAIPAHFETNAEMTASIITDALSQER